MVVSYVHLNLSQKLLAFVVLQIKCKNNEFAPTYFNAAAKPCHL